MTARRRYFVFAQALLLLAGLIWYFFPVLTFGGKYHHERSDSTYEFHNGRFIENGKELGAYNVGLRSVRVHLARIDADFEASIGWNSVTMPIPKYGQSERLTRSE